MTRNEGTLDSVLADTKEKNRNFFVKYLTYAADLGRDAASFSRPSFTEDFAVNGSIALGLLEGATYWLAVSIANNSVTGTLLSAVLIPGVGFLRGLQARYAIRKFKDDREEKERKNESQECPLDEEVGPVGLYNMYGS